MNQNNASRVGGHARLKDDLARLCLPEANRDPDRVLAWINSVCIVFLLIGLLGARRGLITNRTVPPLEEVVPIITEPVVVPPETATEQKKETSTQSLEPAPVAVVLPQAPNINFSVPTLGTLIAANPLNAAPPAQPLRALAKIFSVRDTGKGGDRPVPPYPQISLEDGEQGDVSVLIHADPAGNVLGVDLKSSSGYPVLDHFTLDFIHHHWHLPVSYQNGEFQTTVIYRLQ